MTETTKKLSCTSFPVKLITDLNSQTFESFWDVIAVMELYLPTHREITVEDIYDYCSSLPLYYDECKENAREYIAEVSGGSQRFRFYGTAEDIYEENFEFPPDEDSRIIEVAKRIVADIVAAGDDAALELDAEFSSESFD